MDYTVKRSVRKTIALHITKDGLLEVRAPVQAKKTEIEALISANLGWVSNRIEETNKILNAKNEFRLRFGDKLLLMGEYYPLVGINENKIGFDGNSFYVPREIIEEDLLPCVKKLYIAIAKSILFNKVKYFSNLMGVKPSSVKINSANTRWGSCSSARRINFSWRLIMAPEPAVNYVVVHELAHITHLNHSSQFWNLVSQYSPEYKERRRDLSKLQQKLARENWD